MSKRKARTAGGFAEKPRLRGTLGFVHPGGADAEVKASFMSSVVRTFAYETMKYGMPLDYLEQQCSSGQLVEARNDMVKFFLDNDKGGDWLWIVDSDMGFTVDCFEQLVASADPVERPVMGALCFGLRLFSTDDSVYANQFVSYPTIYVWNERTDDAGETVEVGFTPQLEYPRDTIVQCDATGAACFVVHRTILEKIKAESGCNWFDRLVHPSGKKFGEDLSFFARCAQVGAPVHVNTAVKTSHDKGGVCITEAYYDLIKDRQKFTVDA